MSTHFSKSPIRNVPYEILCEIFVHCLPRYPLDKARQPNVQIAPLLLCHVCSSWRSVALTCAPLWSHLSCRLKTICKSGLDFTSLTFFKNQIEFVRWWSKNQGSVTPSLTFDVDNLHLRSPHTINQDDLIIGDSTDFLLACITTAQYLNIDRLFWEQIQHRNQVSFPNLHTLVVKDMRRTFLHTRHQLCIGSIPNQLLSQLRLERLYITEALLANPDRKNLPLHWTTLTHISLSDVSITVDFWFFFIRAVPNLQWGYFKLDKLLDIDIDVRPTTCTLPKLTTLFVLSYDVYNSTESSFSRLFTSLHLPALQLLSLFRWNGRGAIEDLPTVLSSAPNITTLVLGESFLSFRDLGHAIPGPVEPIWGHAPNLVHLQLELPTSRNSRANLTSDELLNTFVDKAFGHNKRWLDLENSACPIQKITLIDTDLEFRESAVSCVRKLSKKIPNIAIEITSKSAPYEARIAWREWGAIY